MFYELLTSIQWLDWLERSLSATIMAIVTTVVVWVVPLFINWLLSIVRVHSKIRQGCVLILRLVIATSGSFIVGDVLGFNTDFVLSIFVTVFGVGISWAIKDNISNALSGLMLFLFQSYGIGDEIESPSLRFKGIIRSFHLQFVLLEDPETLVNGKPRIQYVPNSYLWTSVVNISHNKAALCQTQSSITNWATQINV